MRLLLEVVTNVVFAAHLLAVNLAMAGPLWLVWLDWRNRRDPNETLRRGERALAGWSLAALGIGVALGAALLGLLILAEDRPYLAAAGMIPLDRLWFGGGELVFYLALLGGYARLARAARPRRGLTRCLAIVAASNLLAHFPPLFAMLATLSHRPELWGRKLERGLYHALLVDPEVLSRVLHIWLAALAGGAIAVIAIASRSAASADNSLTPEGPRPAIRRLLTVAARWGLAATIAEFPVGLWTLSATSTAAWGGEWTGDPLAMLLLGSAIVAAFVLLQQLAAIALGAIEPGTVRRMVIVYCLTTALMGAVAHYWRRLAEPPSGHDRAGIAQLIRYAPLERRAA